MENKNVSFQNLGGWNEKKEMFRINFQIEWIYNSAS